MVDRRHEPRREVSWRGEVAGLAGSGECRIINASSKGLLFAGQLEFSDKALVVLRMRPDSASVVDCAIRIAWSRHSGSEMLFGAEIVHISAVDRQTLSFALMMTQMTAAPAV